MNTNSNLYGKGIFTTIAIFEAVPFLWENHWRRLSQNASRLGIDISKYDEQSVLYALSEAIEKNEIFTGRARVTFSDESSSEIWGGELHKKTTISIITANRREIPENLRLAVSPFRINTTSPLIGIKSCNYLENILATEEAKRRGFDEAIRLNERGEITSASMGNVFWLRDDVLNTPSLTTGCLPGTTREYVLKNFDCREVEAGIGELDRAEAIFLTSAGLGIVEVAEFGSRKMARSGHAILSLWPPV